ncbi:mucin-2-like [Trichomycterus rosablanca]|uniref:mucin-2-like n=1 Tax=Trichomycterus rosablanca TaxID=2290929 RepID=UPI002F351B69
MFSSISNRITNITKTPNIYNEQEIKSDLPSTGKIGDDAEQQETFAESAVLKKKSKGTAFNLKITSVRISSHLKCSKTNKKVDATNLPATDRPSTSTTGHGHKSSHKESDAPVSSFKKTKKRLSRMFSSINNSVNRSIKTINNKQENISDLPSTSGISDKCDKECHPSSTNLPASDDHPILTCIRKSVASTEQTEHVSVTSYIKTPVIYKEQETTSDLPSANGIDEDAEQKETFAVDKEATSNTSNTPELDDHPILTSIEYPGASVEQTEHVSNTSTTGFISGSPTSLAAPSDGCRSGFEQETLPIATVSNAQKQRRLSDKWLPYQEKKKELDEDKKEPTATNPSSTNLPASTCKTSLTPVSPTSSPAPSASRRRVYRISSSNFNSATGWIKTQVIYNLQENVPDLPSTSRIRDKWLLYQNIQNELNKDKEESTATNTSSTNPPASTFKTSLTLVSPTSSPAPSASTRKVFKISFSNSKWIKTPVIYNKQETTSDLPPTSGIDEDAEQQETFAVDKEAIFNTSNTPQLDDHPILTSIKYLVAYVEQTKHVSITSTTGLVSGSPTGLAAPSDGCRGASEQETLPIATVSNEQKQPSWNNQVLVTDLPSTRRFSDKWLPFQHMKKELNEDKEESTATNPSSTNPPASTSITSLTPVSLTSLPAPSASTRRLFSILFNNSNSVTSWIKTPVIYNKQETTSDLPSTSGIDKNAEQQETFAVDKEATSYTSNTPELDDHPILTSIEYPVTSVEQTEHVSNTSTTGLVSGSPTGLAAPSDGCRDASEQETLPIATLRNEQKQPSWNIQVLVTDLPSTCGLSAKWLPHQNMKELDEDKEESTATNPSSTNPPASTCITSLTPVSPTSSPAPSASRRRVYRISSSNFNSATGWTITPVLYIEQETTSDLPSTNGIDEDAEQQETFAVDKEATSYTSNTPQLDDHPILSSINSPAPSASTRKVFKISFSNSKWIKTPVIYNEQETTSDLPSTNGIDEDAEQQETFAVDKEAIFNTSNTPELDDHSILTSIKYLVAYVEQTEHVSNTSTTGLVSGSPTGLAAPSDGCRGASEQETLPIATVSNEQKQPSWNNQVLVTDLPSTSGLSAKWLPYQNMKKELDEDKEESTATNPSSTNPPASTSIASLTPVSPTSSPAPSASRRRVVRISSSNFNSATGWTITPVLYIELETTSDLPSTNGIDEDAEQQETFAVDKEATSNTSNTPQLDDHPILTSIEYPVASVEQTKHVSNTSTTGLVSGWDKEASGDRNT